MARCRGSGGNSSLPSREVAAEVEAREEVLLRQEGAGCCEGAFLRLRFTEDGDADPAH